MIGAASTMAPVLSARSLAIGWRGKGALAQGIELELRSGELAVLVGPNGSGKSTLLRTLVGTQAPLSGDASILGQAVGRLSVEERARRAATVFTDRFDSGYFSVFDIVAFGRYPYTDARGALSDRDVAAVEAAIASAGLAELAGRPFSELSDGERQKALVARAVAQDCPLLVLDEPTAFLDASARVEVFHLVRRLAREAGKAVVLSTHDIDHALRYADRLWLMDGEHRFSSGSPEDLAASGAIGRAFASGGLVFDALTGTFRPELGAEPRSVEIVGPEGVPREWARRLLERLGFEEGRGDGAVARIRIEEGGCGLAFVLETEGGAPERASSYDELASMLRSLR